MLSCFGNRVSAAVCVLQFVVEKLVLGVMTEVMVVVILPCTAALICNPLIFCHWPSCEQINCSRKV